MLRRSAPGAERGRVFPFGTAGHFGDASDQPLSGPIVAIAATPTGRGYWLFGRDGGVFADGDAPFHGAFETISSPVIDAAAVTVPTETPVRDASPGVNLGSV